MVHGRGKVHGRDEDGVGQVKEEGDGEFEQAVRVTGAQKILKASWHLAGGRTRVDIGGGRFIGLGLKTGGASGAAAWRLQRARGIIAKLVSRRSEVVKTACPSVAHTKKWTDLPLRGRLLLGMKTDGNGRENPSTISVSVFYYEKRERERNSQVRERKRDITVTETGGNQKIYQNTL